MATNLLERSKYVVVMALEIRAGPNGPVRRDVGDF